MSSRFDRYLRTLLQTPLEEHTEHTGRSALETLLNEFAAEAEAKGIGVQHEPKRAADTGAPDFKVKHHGMILGYVEVKTFGDDLEKLAKSDQVKRYRQLSDNILLTNYRQFMWLHGDQKQGPATLIHMHELEGRRPRIPPERIPETANIIAAFFSQPPQGIGRAQQLALALAARSRLLREALGRELVRQEAEHREGKLFGLLSVFRDQVFHDLTIKEFADAFAQMLAYGLFLARLNAPQGEAVTLDNARRHIPGSFRLIRELVDFLEVLDADEYDDMRWIVDEVLSIVNGLDLGAIHDDLSFRQRKSISRKVRARDEEEHRLFERDPFIYFYEDYLKAYDPAMRKGRGVYYTPPPVVNFIVRAVDDILKQSFGIAEGFAGYQRVTVLDFACGTGTFLLEVFQRIFENIGGPEVGRADLIVRDHITQNLYGFEYLIAPYTIAHLKLSQYLRDKGHALKDDERVQVYLTNTLEPVEPQQNWLLPAITEEVKAAQAVKDRPILVILGNPPYAAASKNRGAWITAAIEAYKVVDGKHFGERKHWLHDDYVKFIRFAQLKMDAVEEGVVGVITNHSWLDNPTFRGMRQSLMRSFDQIYVLDLHGNTKKQERALDGSEDQNVFDIEQGVAVSLFVKNSALERGVWRGDLWGKRLDKYRAVAESSFTSFTWNEIRVEAPQYLFKELKSDEKRIYDELWLITEIFLENSPGIITARDRFAIAFNQAELEERVLDLIKTSLSDNGLRRKYNLKDTRGWSLSNARLALRVEPDWKRSIRQIIQAPFDVRQVPHDPRIIDWGRWGFASRIPHKEIGLCLSRKIDIQRPWEHVFVADELIVHRLGSNLRLPDEFALAQTQTASCPPPESETRRRR